MAQRWMGYAVKWLVVTFLVGFVAGIVFADYIILGAAIVWVFSGLYLFKQIDAYVDGKVRRQVARQ